MAATLSVLPALVLSSSRAQAILIHDHHGHDTHSHTVSIHELDKLPGNPEHQHEEHEHDYDGPIADFADGDGSSIVILWDVPEGLARGRVLSSSGAAAPGSRPTPSTNPVAFVTQQPERSYTARPGSIAPPLRARSLLQGILLTSHALLL